MESYMLYPGKLSSLIKKKKSDEETYSAQSDYLNCSSAVDSNAGLHYLSPGSRQQKQTGKEMNRLWKKSRLHMIHSPSVKI